MVEPPAEAVLGTYEGIYRFTVDEVIAGDPGDGRVYNPQAYGRGGYRFEIGGLYEVHADRRTADERGAGAELVTGECYAIRELAVGPVRYAVGVIGWMWSAFGTWIVLIGVLLVARMVVRRGSSAVGRSTPAVAE